MEAIAELVFDNMVCYALTGYPQDSDRALSRLFGSFVYFIFASLSYFLVFDHATFTHPKYLKNQVRLEIAQTLKALPLMAVLTVPFFFAEIKGYAKLYDAPAEAPFALYNILQFPLFILFTDFFVYWIHRALHHPRLYKTFHKPHHKWIMPTPFASHAFHPVDGWAQSVPYHVFPFLFPLQKFAYIFLFVTINIWTIAIRKSSAALLNPPVTDWPSFCRRWRIRLKFTHHQRRSLPHHAPFVLQLQLWSIYHSLGSTRRILPGPEYRTFFEREQDE